MIDRSKSYLFIGNVPEPELAVEAAGEEVPVVLGVEDDRGDEVDVLEAAEALAARDVPQADRLVHGAGEDEVVLGPGDVEQVGGVSRVDAERLGTEGRGGPEGGRRGRGLGRRHRLLRGRGGRLLFRVVLRTHVLTQTNQQTRLCRDVCTLFFT